MARVHAVALASVLVVTGALAWSQERRVSIGEIRADANRFHGQLVVVAGTLTREGERLLLSGADGTLRLIGKSDAPPGDVEVRGTALDVGRLQGRDPILARHPEVAAAFRSRWPKPGEEFAIAVTDITAQSREVAAVTVTPLPPLPLDVTFSAPIEGEADVRLDARIRLQFSSDVNEASLANRIRVAYSLPDSIERGEAQPPSVAFTSSYDAGLRALEIRPMQPLERFRQVHVQLLEGIVGTDGSVLELWTLTFTTGGS